MLAALGLDAELEPKGCPIREIRVTDGLSPLHLHFDGTGDASGAEDALRQANGGPEGGIDQELLDLYDYYAHGIITKREFLDRAAKFTAGGVTAVALLNMLSPNYALAEQVSPVR